MRITRFLDSHAQPAYGIDRGDGTADPLRGTLGTGLEPTGGRPVPIGRRLAPVEPVNVFCIGLNYRKHAAETGAELPQHPVVFMKPTSALAQAPQLKAAARAAPRRRSSSRSACTVASSVSPAAIDPTSRGSQ